MARRSAATDLAGLAGLAILGYQLLKDNKAPVKSLAPESKTEPDYGEDYAREVARGGRGPVAVGETKPKSLRAEGPKGPSGKTAEAPAAKPQRTEGRGTGSAQMADYIMRREMDKEAGMSRGRREAGAPKTTVNAPAAPAKALTREEMISQIPGSAPANWQGGSGERIDSTELGRQLKNTAVPLGVMMGPGMSMVGNASRVGTAARLAEKAAEREAVTNPLQWMAGRGGELARKALNEADTTGGAIGYKKGGSTRKAIAKKASFDKGGAVKKESKPTAKGWGMARGGRPAKIY